MWPSRIRLSVLIAALVPGAFASVPAEAQPRRAAPQPAATQASADAAVQDARLRALEDQVRDLAKRAGDAEAKADSANRRLAETQAEQNAAVEIVKRNEEERKKADAARAKKEEEAQAAARKKAEEEAARSRDFQPEKIPFAFADFSWMPGNYGPPDHPFASGPFTGELRVDTASHYSYNHPKCNSISGSNEVFRHV